MELGLSYSQYQHSLVDLVNLSPFEREYMQLKDHLYCFSFVFLPLHVICRWRSEFRKKYIDGDPS